MRILRWWLEHNLRRAPKNKALACRIDDWLLQPPPAGGRLYRAWARLLLPLAMLRLGKACDRGGGSSYWGGGGGGAGTGAAPGKAKIDSSGGGGGGGSGGGGGYFRPDTPGGTRFTNLADIKVSTSHVAAAAAAGFASDISNRGLRLGAPAPLLLQLPTPLFPGGAASAASAAAAAAAAGSVDATASPGPLPIKRSRTATATTLRFMDSSGGGKGGGRDGGGGGGGGGGAALDISDVRFALRTMSLKQIAIASASGSGGGSSATSPFLTTTGGAAAAAATGSFTGVLSRRGSRLSRGRQHDLVGNSGGQMLIASRRSFRSGRSQRSLVAGAGVLGSPGGGMTVTGAGAAAAMTRSFSSRFAVGFAALGGAGRRGTAATEAGQHDSVDGGVGGGGSAKNLIARMFSVTRQGSSPKAPAVASGPSGAAAAAGSSSGGGRMHQMLLLPQLPPTLLEDPRSEEDEVAAASHMDAPAPVGSSPAAPFPSHRSTQSFSTAVSDAEAHGEADDIFSVSKWRSEPDSPPAFGAGEAELPEPATGLLRPQAAWGLQSPSGNRLAPGPAPLLTSPTEGSPLIRSPAGSFSTNRSLMPRPLMTVGIAAAVSAAAAAAAASQAAAHRLPRRTTSSPQQHQFGSQSQLQLQVPSSSSRHRAALSRMARDSDGTPLPAAAAHVLAGADPSRWSTDFGVQAAAAEGSGGGGRRRFSAIQPAVAGVSASGDAVTWAGANQDSRASGYAALQALEPPDLPSVLGNTRSPQRQTSPELLHSPDQVAAAAADAAAAAEAAALANTVLHNLMLRFGGGGGSKEAAAAVAPSPARHQQQLHIQPPLSPLPGRDSGEEATQGSSGGATPHYSQGPASSGAIGSRAFQPWTDTGFLRVSIASTSGHGGSTSGMVMPTGAAAAAVAAAAAAVAASRSVTLSPRLPLRSRLASFRRSSAVTAQELLTATGQPLGLGFAAAAAGIGRGASRGVIHSAAGAAVDASSAVPAAVGTDGGVTLAPQPQLPRTLVLRSSAAGLGGSGSGGGVRMSAGSEQTQEQAAKAVPGIDIEAPAVLGSASGAASPVPVGGQVGSVQPGQQQLRARSLGRLAARVESGPITLQQSYKALRNLLAVASPTAAPPTTPVAPAAAHVAPAAMPVGEFDGDGSGAESALGARGGGALLRRVLPRATVDGDGAATAESPRAPIIRVSSQSSFGALGRTQTVDGAVAVPGPVVAAYASTAAGSMDAVSLAFRHNPPPKRGDSVPGLLSRVPGAPVPPPGAGVQAEHQRPAPQQVWLQNPSNSAAGAAADGSSGRQPAGGGSAVGWSAHVAAAATAAASTALAAPAESTATANATAAVVFGRLPVTRSGGSIAMGPAEPQIRPVTAGASTFTVGMPNPAAAPVVPLARFASTTGKRSHHASQTSAAPVAAAAADTPSSPPTTSSAHIAALVAQHEQRQRHQEQPRLRPAGTSTFDSLAFEEGEEEDVGGDGVQVAGVALQKHWEQPAGAGGGLPRPLPTRVSSVPDWRLFVNAAAAAEHAGQSGHGAEDGVEEHHLHAAAVGASASGATRAAAPGPASFGGGQSTSRLTRFAYGMWMAAGAATTTHNASLGGGGGGTGASREHAIGSITAHSGLQSPMLRPLLVTGAGMAGAAAAAASRTAVLSTSPAPSTAAATTLTSPRSAAGLGGSAAGGTATTSRLAAVVAGAWAADEPAASSPVPAAAPGPGPDTRGVLAAGPGPVAEALEVTSEEEVDGSTGLRVATHRNLTEAERREQCKQRRGGVAAAAGEASRYASHTRTVLVLVAAMEVMVSELRAAEQQLQVRPLDMAPEHSVT